ncbi:hypothetical protein ABEB36_011264 [Hypothenemus hampei]|uniref:Death domain-containing protein n=1 Tax=Hypothenemus hampei TaxID=57062 RepID=A0ABD1EEU0_HYPHA
MSQAEYTTDAVPDRHHANTGFEPEKENHSENKRNKKHNENILSDSDDSLDGITSGTQNTNSTIFYKCSALHFGHIYNLGTHTKWPTNPEPRLKETTLIKKMKLSNVPVIEKDLYIVGQHIGKGCFNLFRNLGLTQQLVERYEMRYREDIDGLIHKLLIVWKQENGKKATVGLLAQALWDSKEINAINEWSNQYDEIHK